ncbi:MAG: hypothetical protein OEZ36_01325 [Spirochaetota bacterium]|nr:hypothetical protein [Spirochaetota bacterium]
MHKISLFVLSVFSLILISDRATSHPGHGITYTHKHEPFEAALINILKKHQTLLKIKLDELDSEIEDMDRAFLIDTSFTGERMTKSFFHTIKANIESGKMPRGLMHMSYTKFVSINGQFKSIHYSYRVRGEKVILTRATNNNGNVLRAVYQYNQSGNLLNIQEYKGNKLLSDKSHIIKI